MRLDAAVLAATQVAVMVVLTPLLIGLMRQVRSRLEGRAGAGIAQPWRDVRKLLAKEVLKAPGTWWVQATGP
ncbi:MAG: formate hydrogenlyase, partial [Candidatus Nanopelagicales bacterium]